MTALGVFVALFSTSARAAADPPALEAQLTCTPASEAGRVRCEVQAQVKDARITWADAEIVKVPDHITPLKGRIGPRDATQKEAQAWRLSLALVAKRTGEGPVIVRVRAVACTPKADAKGEAKEACVPLTAEATGQVKVGT